MKDQDSATINDNEIYAPFHRCRSRYEWRAVSLFHRALSPLSKPLATRRHLRAARDGVPSQSINRSEQREQRIPQNRKAY
jgi:hypothetical protein